MYDGEPGNSLTYVSAVHCHTNYLLIFPNIFSRITRFILFHSLFQFGKDAGPHKISDTSLNIPVHYQSTNFSNPKIRKKRKAPPPPSPAVTQPAMSHPLSNRSLQNLCCSNFNLPPSKSSSFVQINCADDQDETEKRDLTYLAASSVNSKASSVGFSSASGFCCFIFLDWLKHTVLFSINTISARL